MENNHREAALAGATEFPTVTLVLPCFNEAKNLPAVFGLIPEFVTEVLLVDGGSSDDSVAVARSLRPDIRVLGQHSPGKGLALAIGLLEAASDVVVLADTDCSMDFSEMESFVHALVRGADLVKGTRHLPPGGSDDFTIIRRIGNLGLVKLVNLLYRTKLTDVTYGYAAFWTDTVRSIGLDEIIAREVSKETTAARRPKVYGHGFEIEVMLACRTAHLGYTVAEVPCHEHLREHGVSKLTVFRDGFRNLHAILFERFGTHTAHVRTTSTIAERMKTRRNRMHQEKTNPDVVDGSKLGES
jgi:glycosyltransferase involved in cell wall biosynthesis